MRNNLIETSYKKCGGETILRPFSKKSKLSTSFWINSLNKVLCSCFYCVPSEGYQNILKLSCRPLAFTTYKAFLKHKKWSGTSLFGSCSA